ncbi:MAG: ECF transporter S component [Tissierellia bacterium]|nr:ECF transporter S component [Tissierellia bacterium]
MTDMTQERNKDLRKVNTIVKIGILAALAGVLMIIFKFPLPFAPPFMTVDFGDVPTLIAGFALGPVAGIVTVVIKNIINLMLNGTMTAFVGELSNIIVGSAFVGISALYYQKRKTRKAAIVGLIIGLLSMTIIATLSNYFLVFPLYAKAFGIPVQALVDQAAAINTNISSFESLMLFAVVPFNLVKGALNSLVTVFIYKYISNIFKRI